MGNIILSLAGPSTPKMVPKIYYYCHHYSNPILSDGWQARRPSLPQPSPRKNCAGERRKMAFYGPPRQAIGRPCARRVRQGIFLNVGGVFSSRLVVGEGVYVKVSGFLCLCRTRCLWRARCLCRARCLGSLGEEQKDCVRVCLARLCQEVWGGVGRVLVDVSLQGGMG
jgi:hypothetical protein